MQTDFIFTVAGEELGFVGCAVIVGLLGIIIFRAIRAAPVADDMFGMLVASGVAVWFGVQSFVNIGMTIGIMPITGLPLPFVSYGGSAAFADMIAVGLLQSVRRHHSIFLESANSSSSGSYRTVTTGPFRSEGILRSMSVESVYPRLEPLLPQVRKPVQYVGGEVNSTVKEWDETDVRWALLYPDAYEVGLPNQGIAILYEVLNEQPGVLAERTYSVWPDLERLMREQASRSSPSTRTGRSARSTCSAISFSTELGYTNLLTALDLAKIPLLSAERTDAHPVVVAGGHAAFNPEPVADFLDAVVLGDGEEAVLAITALVREWKQRGLPRRPGRAAAVARRHRRRVRAAVLRRAVPAGRPDRAGGAQPAWRARLGAQAHAARPRRVAVPEGAGGARSRRPCTSGTAWRSSAAARAGCRFCQAGMITRPVRERSITTVGKMVESGIAATGFAEVGLLSLSSADHSEINEIAVDLADCYEGSNVGLSLPSTRVDAFNVTLADELSRNGKRSGLTFAPEGGSERMRAVINKMVTEDDLIRTVTTAYSSGWRQVKLYFMCGLPTETDDDVLAIADLARQRDRRGPGGDRAPRHPVHGLHRRVRAEAAHAVPVGRAVPARGGGRHGCARSGRRCGPTGPTASRSATGTTTARRR